MSRRSTAAGVPHVTFSALSTFLPVLFPPPPQIMGTMMASYAEGLALAEKVGRRWRRGGGVGQGKRIVAKTVLQGS